MLRWLDRWCLKSSRRLCSGSYGKLGIGRKIAHAIKVWLAFWRARFTGSISLDRDTLDLGGKKTLAAEEAFVVVCVLIDPWNQQKKTGC